MPVPRRPRPESSRRAASRSPRSFLTPLLHDLPQATLAATIIVAVLSLVDLGALQRTCATRRSDFAAMAATILLTLFVGVETGVVAGVGLLASCSISTDSAGRISAIVGQVPGTEHFRNVLRHEVTTEPASAEHPRRREPVLRQRPLPGGPDLRARRRRSGDRACRPDLPRNQRDRRQRARKPGGDQSPAPGLRRHLPPLGGQGPGHGSPQRGPSSWRT